MLSTCYADKLQSETIVKASKIVMNLMVHSEKLRKDQTQQLNKLVSEGQLYKNEIFNLKS